jgi:hypothetical protein
LANSYVSSFVPLSVIASKRSLRGNPFIANKVSNQTTRSVQYFGFLVWNYKFFKGNKEINIFYNFFGLPRKLRLLAMTKKVNLPIVSMVDSLKFLWIATTLRVSQ